MRVLLDEQLPRQLAAELVGHQVRTVQQQRWSGHKNGELLREAMREGFEAFVTADGNLEFQQNITRSGMFVVVLNAPSNALEDLLPLVPSLLTQLSNPQAGKLVHVRA